LALVALLPHLTALALMGQIRSLLLYRRLVGGVAVTRLALPKTARLVAQVVVGQVVTRLHQVVLVQLIKVTPVVVTPVLVMTLVPVVVEPVEWDKTVLRVE
jgi:uncharacterized membrane protein AbrB (regulator of aidB expression)